MKIAIDAGHGDIKYTAGKRTPEGYAEHWANVMVASYFAQAMDRCGVRYIKTGWNDDIATDDPDYALSIRQSTIKANNCEYSISFHFNAYGDGKSYNSAQGIEVLISNKYPRDSKRMADSILAELIKGTKQVNRGVKTQSLAMCNCQAMNTTASVLIECGFMTNQYEAKLMQSHAFCKETAEEAARGFCKYAGINYVADGEKLVYEPSAKPQTYTVKSGDTLSKIASKYNTTYKKLAEINGISDPNKIRVGQVIKIG